MFHSNLKKGKDITSVERSVFSMANGKSLILGIMVGGTVSAAATLLSTPSSGRDFR